MMRANPAANARSETQFSKLLASKVGAFPGFFNSKKVVNTTVSSLRIIREKDADPFQSSATWRTLT
jgi:hypothetical protein